MTDPIAAARALIEPLTGYTPGAWEPSFGEAYRVRSDGMNIATAHFVTLLDRIPTKQVAANARLIAAAPDLKSTLETALDALDAKDAEIERMRKSLIIANDFLNKCDYQPGRDFAGIMVRAALNTKDTQ